MELLSPAGSLQKLRYAVWYGADAIYVAGKQFGLRAKSSNLDRSELQTAVTFCHKNNCKLYVTVNIFAHNRDIRDLPKYLEFLQHIGVDALIISDPAIFSLAQDYAPVIPIHISTQANVTSWKSTEFWYKQGAKRIILARELTVSEIREIREKVPEIELEMFVHGAMCMSYSGRCLLSSFLNARSANQGHCTQPCRWEYHLQESSRPQEFFKIEEEDRGTYILNSKDLCLINRLAEINAAGIDSVKIEGRMKSLYYVANVTRSYREAIQLTEENQSLPDELRAELDKVSHRHYTEAFFDVFDSEQTQYHATSAYSRNYQFIGEIIENNGNEIKVAIRAKFKKGDDLEFIFPQREADFNWLADKFFDEEDNLLESTKPNTIVKFNLPKNIPTNGIIRLKK
jgi:putative protease